MRRVNIYEEFNKERTAQMKKWGPQSWPVVKEECVEPEDFGQGGYNDRATQIAFRHAIQREEKYKRQCDKRTQDGTLAWADILLEECVEVIFSTNLDDARKELVQLGAVVVSMIEDIDAKLAGQDPKGKILHTENADLKDVLEAVDRYMDKD